MKLKQVNMDREGVWQHVIHCQCPINQLLNHMLMFTHMVIIGGVRSYLHYWYVSRSLPYLHHGGVSVLCLVSGDEALPHEWKVQRDSPI